MIINNGMREVLRLSEYAKRMGIHYKTAFLWWKSGKIDGAYKTASGSVMVPAETDNGVVEKVVVYARVSSYSKKSDLDRQVVRCMDYCASRGYSVSAVYKEIASGMNDNRKILNKLFAANPTVVVIDNKDRLTRFGFNYISTLLGKLGCRIEVLNPNMDDEQDLMKDMIAIVTSFCCRLYGARRGQNRAAAVKGVLSEKVAVD